MRLTGPSVRRRRSRWLVVATAVTMASALPATSAIATSTASVPRAASTTVPQVVSDVPAATTGNVDDGTVNAIARTGPVVVVGGSFHSVSPAGGTAVTSVTDLAAFDATDGAVIGRFAPTLDGVVDAVAPGPSTGTVYVGGAFHTLDGVSTRLALVDTRTGAIVSGWHAPALDGAVDSVVLSHGILWVGGEFDTAGTTTRHGLATLDPTTGALTTYSTLSFTGHHNFGRSCHPASETCADAGVGVRSIAVNPDGTRLVAVGNFTDVSGDARDQAAVIDLGSSSATVDSGWATDAFTDPCHATVFDSSVRQVAFSPDGSYFVVASTGGAGTGNTDGTETSCDGAVRFETGSTGADVHPTWVAATGEDTLLSVAVTDSAIYVGGHERWLNNAQGHNVAAEGAVPRPGVAALDPANGMPLTWNPGRNPRGAGASALLVTSDGLYVGSDTEFIGNRTYLRKRLAFFPLAGGAQLAGTRVAALPGEVFLGNPAGHSGRLEQLSWNGTGTPGRATTDTHHDWSDVTGAADVGGELYTAHADGTLTMQSFGAGGAGPAVGPTIGLDPYDDPVWSDLPTGSGQTYQGVPASFAKQMPSLTSMFAADGRLYYTLSGSPHMFWRWFEPDDGAVGADQFRTTDSDNWQHIAGAFVSGSTLYAADATNGHLTAGAFTNGEPSGTRRVVDTSRDWRAGFDIVMSSAQTSDHPPVASFTARCASATCTVNGAASHDDGSVTTYAWSWGDGTTTRSSTATASHHYARSGDYRLTLTVTDNGDVTGSKRQTVHAGGTSVSFQGVTVAHGHSRRVVARLPHGAKATDVVLVFESHQSTTAKPTPSRGWKRIGRTHRAGLATDVYRRTQAAAHAKRLAIRYSRKVRARLVVVDYRHAAVESLHGTTGRARDRLSAHPLARLRPGSVAVSFWTALAPRQRRWSAPGQLTVRANRSGRPLSSLLADTLSPVSASYDLGVGMTSGKSHSLAEWSVGLRRKG